MRTKMTAWSLVAALVGVVGCGQGHTGLVDSGQDSGWLDASIPDAGDSGIPDPSCIPPTAFGCFFQSGQDVWVDGFAGADFDGGACCCGTPSLPCQSLTYAMATIADGGTVGVQILAYLSDGGELWPAPEYWPVHLGLGVTVTAPDILFSPPQGSGPPHQGYDVFQVYPYSPTDGYEVVVQGDSQDAGRLVMLGLAFDAGMDSRSPVLSAVEDPPQFTTLTGLPLRLSNVLLQGDYISLVVGYNAALTIGPLPVHIGSFLGSHPYHGAEEGIDCFFASIQDIASHVLQIDSQEFDIIAHYNCSVLLPNGPSFGLKPSTTGFATCPGKRDGYAVGALANSTVTLGSLADPAELHCFFDSAIGMSDGDTGIIPPLSSPSVAFVGNESNADCFGAAVGGGSLTATASSFEFNRVGIWDSDKGIILLDSFPDFMNTPATQVSCNSVQENPIAPCLSTGVLTTPYNSNVAITNGALGASADLNNVSWTHWDSDAGTPQVWLCYDSAFQQCSCSGPGCPPSGGLQAITESTQADVVYQGSALDAGLFPFSVGFGFESVCP